MEQVINFFNHLFDTDGFPARWHCGSAWDQFTGWFYIISNLMIWSAYFAIPTIIITYISRRKHLRFSRIYVLFASFILACGTTHFLDALVFWVPVYRITSIVLFLTGCISWLTVIQMIKLLPIAFSLKSAEELQKEVHHRRAAEKKLTVSISQLNDAQRLARFGHWQWDITTDVVSWSDGVYRIYGIPDGQTLVYEDVVKCTHPDDQEYVRQCVDHAIARQESWEYYHRIILADGSIKTIHALGNVGLDESGQVSVLFGTVQDVTEQKRVEQELFYKTQTLEATNQELEKFASIASHDLREPLRKIITFATMMQQQIKQGYSLDIYTDKIVSVATRMQQLVDDILSYSRLNSVQQDFDSVDLNEVVANVLQDLEIQIRQKQAVITVEALPRIEGNPTQLRQLFQNLLSNAIKFALPGIPPKVHIRATILEGNQYTGFSATDRDYPVLSNPKYWAQEQTVRLDIEDNGIGFDEAYLDKIFVIFQRLNDKNSYEGTGIGLAICKKVVDAHHGQINARSKLGEGATFTILLPLSQQKFRTDQQAS